MGVTLLTLMQMHLHISSKYGSLHARFTGPAFEILTVSSDDFSLPFHFDFAEENKY